MDGDRQAPVDYRLYNKTGDGLTKNEHFQRLLRTAYERGLIPQCVVFDSWYGSLENLKLIREFGWVWLTQLKANRHLNLDRTGHQVVSEVDLPLGDQVIHVKG